MQLIFDVLGNLFDLIFGLGTSLLGHSQRIFQIFQVAFEVVDELPAFLVVFPTGVVSILFGAVGIHIVRTIFGR